MAKRRLTEQQQRRIQQRQDKRIIRADQAQADRTATDLGPEEHGLVVAYYGKGMVIEAADGTLHDCVSKQNLEPVVCGDRVVWQRPLGEQGNGLVVAVQPRRSLLLRPGFAGRLKPVASNLDRIFIVAAPLPELSLGLLDRYLVAAEHMGVESCIVLNKVDLLSPQQLEETAARLQVYRDLGYPVIYTSTHQDHGLDTLLQAMAGHTAIFVGQSGVGKSSLISSLIVDATIRVGDVSAATGKGAHTTTSSRLYHLPCGGDIIDSPGVREFALTHIEPEQLAGLFRDLRPYINRCRFRNCNHRDSEGCAIQQAVADGEVSETRYQSYLRIYESI